MDGAGANMCKAINIEGVAVKATYVSKANAQVKKTNFGHRQSCNKKAQHKS